MRVRIGYQDKTYGTVEDTPDGLVYTGNQPKLREVVEGLRRYARPHEQADAPLVASIPRQLNNGYWWSQDTAEEPPEMTARIDAEQVHVPLEPSTK